MEGVFAKASLNGMSNEIQPTKRLQSELTVMKELNNYNPYKTVWRPFILPTTKS